MERVSNIKVENAKITFRNFSGNPDKYDKKGHRSFSLILDKDLADRLSEDGWNVRVRVDNRDPDSDPRYLLNVAVSYDNYPPKIYMITSSNKVLLDEDSVGQLDDADISNIDLVIRPYQWEVNGKSGIKAYVKYMYVTIEEDCFAYKYNNQNNPQDDDDYPF